jgi:hypothetical protein
MEIIYLASVERLKELYTIDSNLEDGYILPIIIKCQDLVLKPIFCKKDWDNIIKEVKEDTFTGNTEEILRYFEPIIAHYILAESIYAIAFKNKNNPDYLDKNDIYKEITYLNGKYMSDVKAYKNILIEYLCTIGMVSKKSDFNMGVCLW